MQGAGIEAERKQGKEAGIARRPAIGKRQASEQSKQGMVAAKKKGVPSCARWLFHRGAILRSGEDVVGLGDDLESETE